MHVLEKDRNVILYGSDSIREAFFECAKFGLLFPFIPFIDMSTQELLQISDFSAFGFPFTHYVSGLEVEIRSGSNTKVIKYGGTIYKTNTTFNIVPLLIGSKIHQITGSTKYKLFTDLQSEQIKFRWTSIKILPPKQIYLSDLRQNRNSKYIVKQGENIYAISEEIVSDSVKIDIPKDIDKLEKLFFKKALNHISVETELTKVLKEHKNLLIISEKEYFLCLSLNE